LKAERAEPGRLKEALGMGWAACSEDDHSCGQYAKCNIRDPLWRIKDRIVSTLAATSVAELAVEMPQPLAPLAPGAMPIQMVKRT
jgi:hypothetical protein